jgi:hypothetical protein
MSELPPYSPSCELQIDEDLAAIEELAEFADEPDQPSTINLQINNKYRIAHDFMLIIGNSITRMVVRSSNSNETYYDIFSFADPRVNEDGSLRDWFVMHTDQNRNHLSKASALVFLADHTETMRRKLQARARANDPKFIPVRQTHG